MSGLTTIFRKELADSLGSRRIAVLGTIVVLASMSAVMAAVESPGLVRQAGGSLFLSLLTERGGNLPSFLFFVIFLVPLLGILLGFDAINAERQRGTLSLLLSQPIYRDSLINGKFLASLAAVTLMMGGVLALIGGISMAKLGVVPTGEEVLRALVFFGAAILYAAFWLSLSILFSVYFDKTSTSALTALALWIFLAFFVQLVAGMAADHVVPVTGNSAVEELIRHENLKIGLLRLSPAYLLQEISLVVLNPGVRVLGPMDVNLLREVIPSALKISQSLMIIWPQLTALAALSIVCFAASYISFMRREIRS